MVALEDQCIINDKEGNMTEFRTSIIASLDDGSLMA